MIELGNIENTFTDVTAKCDISESFLDSKLLLSEKQIKVECADTIKFFNENQSFHYEIGDIETRISMIQDLHSRFQDSLCTDSKLVFEELDANDMGYHDDEKHVIGINSMLLNNTNPKEVILTDLHELRHDFQHMAINNPLAVDIDEKTLHVWEDNFKNYISPEFDFEEYSKQPVEVDANNFANSIYEAAQNIVKA